MRASKPMPIAALASVAVRRAEELLAEIQRKKDLVAESFVDIGEALLELDKKKLWAALGYSSLSHLLSARNVMGRSQAFKLMAVVRSLPRRQALALGAEKAYALIRYAHASPTLERPTDVLAHGIVIDGKRKPIAELTARDIVRQAQETAEAKATRSDPERKAAHKAAATVQRALAKRGVHATVSAVRVSGTWLLDVRAPADAFARALG
jgi:hypothetical protein